MMSTAVTTRFMLRAGLSAALFAVLTVLIVVPLAMVLYTSVIDVLPFSGERPAQWTLDNLVRRK